MSDNNVPENKPEPDKKSQSVIANSLKVMETAEYVKDSERKVRDAALIGACFVFLIAMLGAQKQESALTTSLVCFVIAIPMLTWGIITASYKPKPDKPHPLLAALYINGWIVEALGWLSVAVGVAALIKHISPIAFTSLIITIVSVIAVGIFGSLIGLFIYGFRKSRMEKQEQKETQVQVIKTDNDGLKQVRQRFASRTRCAIIGAEYEARKFATLSRCSLTDKMTPISSTMS